MARFDTTGLNEVLREMQRMGLMTGEVAEAMIKTGAEYVKLAWQQAADECDHRVTGDMINSIGYPRQPQNIGDGLAIDIYPQGKDHKGVRNAEKAFILHYGSSKLKGSRWVDRADEISEQTAIPAMENVFYEYVETGRINETAPMAYARRR